MILETRQLQFFSTVAHDRHFSRAAERLNLAQPYLSQQIRKLERQLGTTLLTRTTRSVSLTAAGVRLLEESDRVLEELDSIGKEVQLIGAGFKGLLRLGFTGSTTYGVMPQIVRRTSAEVPLLKLSVSGEMVTPQLIGRLLERSIDIALLRGGVQESGLASEVVGKEVCTLAVPSGSTLDVAEPIDATELREHALVGYPVNSVMSETTTAFLAEHSARPNYSIRASETSTLMSLVASGLGAAVIPLTATSIGIPGVRFRKIDQSPQTELTLVWREGEDNPSIGRMRRIIADIVSDNVDDPTIEGEENQP